MGFSSLMQIFLRSPLSSIAVSCASFAGVFACFSFTDSQFGLLHSYCW